MINLFCPRCGNNVKKMVKPGGVRTSPLYSYCVDCDRLRRRIARDRDKRVRDYERLIRELR